MRTRTYGNASGMYRKSRVIEFSQTFSVKFSGNMSPIARSAVRLTQRIRDSGLRNRTLSLVQEATKQPDLAHFTVATLK